MKVELASPFLSRRSVWHPHVNRLPCLILYYICALLQYIVLYCTMLSLAKRSWHPHLFQEGVRGIPISLCYIISNNLLLFKIIVYKLCYATSYSLLQTWRWHPHLFQKGGGCFPSHYTTLYLARLYDYTIIYFLRLCATS